MRRISLCLAVCSVICFAASCADPEPAPMGAASTTAKPAPAVEPAPAESQAGKAAPKTDFAAQANQKIADRIAKALEEVNFGGQNVGISFQGGVATIEGRVGSENERSRAAQIARQVAGVTQVENKLSIDPKLAVAATAKVENREKPRELASNEDGPSLGDTDPPSGSNETSRSKDNQKVATAIAEALREAKLQSYEIDIQFKSGVATLEGHVNDIDSVNKATDVVSQVAGVEKVENHLSVGAARETDSKSPEALAKLEISTSKPIPDVEIQPKPLDPQPSPLPDADTLVEGMAKFFEKVTAFEVKRQTITAQEDSRFIIDATLVAARPNRLSLVVAIDDMQHVFASDGKSMRTSIAGLNKYTEETAPESLDDITQIPILRVLNSEPTGLFLLNLVGDDPEEAITDDVEEVTYVAREEIGGKPVHRLRFEEQMFDWDLWIAAEGDPLPQRISVDMSKWLKEMAAQNPSGNIPKKVELASYFHDWKIGTEPTDEQFAFTVPEGAEKVDSFFPDGRGMGRDRPSPLLGKAAPALELDLLDGGTFSLASHQGKQVVILDFWATWCGPCVAAMPLVAEVAEAYKDKGVVVYAVNQQEEPADIKEFFEDKEFKATVALDAEGDAATKFGVEGIPMLVMVGLDGTVQAVHVGFDPDLKKVLSKDLDKLLAGEKLVDKPAEEKPADEKGSDPPPSPEETGDKDKPADAEKPADSGDKPAEGDTPFGESN